VKGFISAFLVGIFMGYNLANYEIHLTYESLMFIISILMNPIPIDVSGSYDGTRDRSPGPDNRSIAAS